MAYNNAIPQATDKISDSQLALLNNFAAIKTLVDINHVTFDDPSGNQGKHKYISFPEQAASPVTAANEVALFSRQSAHTGLAALCVRDESNGVVVEFTTGLATNQGWTRLPSGILLKWGNSTANGLSTITFPVAATIPAFTQILQIIVSTAYVLPGSDGDGFVRLNSFIAPWTTFTVWGSPRTTVGTKLVAFNFLAIGI